MPDGYWTSLVPNQHRNIIIQGRSYTIPDTHHCVFIQSGHRTKSHFSHETLKELPSIQFCHYPAENILECLDSFDIDDSEKDWLTTVHTIYQNRLGKSLQFQDLSTLVAWQRYYLLQTDGDLEQARTFALYLFASLHFHPHNLHFLKSILPVNATHWDTAHDLAHIPKDGHFLTDDQLQIQTVLTTHFTSLAQTHYPVVWIQGDAGCGKDFVVDKVLTDLKKPYLRAKGSNLQHVLQSADTAKKNGAILVIEEADLLCPQILESLLDPMLYPNFSIIATVNGIEYSGRQPASKGIMKKALVVHCQPISQDDIRGLLIEKFSNSISLPDIDMLVSLYAQLTISLSPRELYSIVTEHLSSKWPLPDCWTHKIETLQRFRPSNTIYKDSLTEEARWLHQKIQELNSQPSIQKEVVAIPHSEVTSAIGKTLTYVKGYSLDNYLPISYYTVDKNGVQRPVSRQDSADTKGKSGWLCLQNLYLTGLIQFVDEDTICMLPIPTGTQPDRVTLGTDRHTTEMQSIHQDSLGRYYIYIPHMDDSYYLGIHYTKELGQRFGKPAPISSVKCYTDYRLKLPTSIQQCMTDHSLTQTQKLEDLCRLFKHMTYDISPMVAQSYEDLKGENRVNQFFSYSVEVVKKPLMLLPLLFRAV